MRIFTNIILIISSVLFGVGYLFKMQHWPGASFAFILGYGVSLIAVLFYFILRYTKKNEIVSSTYCAYFLIFTIVGGVIVSQPYKASRQYFNDLHSLSVQYDRICAAQFVINENIIENNFDSTTAEHELHLNAIATLRLIQEAKYYMVYSMTGGVDDDSIPLGKDNQDVGSIYLFYSKGEEIKRAIEKYNKSLLQLAGMTSTTISVVDVSDSVDKEGLPYTWQQRISEHLPLVNVLNHLSAIQLEITARENIILNRILIDRQHSKITTEKSDTIISDN